MIRFGLLRRSFIACARAGKHVVVEKPIALQLHHAGDMFRKPWNSRQ